MFEVGGRYENRKGVYVVLAINEPKMTVEFDDGTVADLNINIQSRIWENIVAENESRLARSAARRPGSTGKFYIRTVDALGAEELAQRGRKESAPASEIQRHGIGQGDRLIYYAVEDQVFFAVATITGTPDEASGKDAIGEAAREANILLYPIDVDAQALDLARAVSVDAVEFESQPRMRESLRLQDQFVAISEDDFELLAEMLTEVTEEDEDVDLEEEEEEEEFED